MTIYPISSLLAKVFPYLPWILFFRFGIHVVWFCSCLIAFLIQPEFSISFLILLDSFFSLVSYVFSDFLTQLFYFSCVFFSVFNQYFSFFHQLPRGFTYSILSWFYFCYNLVYLNQRIELIVFLLCGLIGLN